MKFFLLIKGLTVNNTKKTANKKGPPGKQNRDAPSGEPKLNT